MNDFLYMLPISVCCPVCGFYVWPLGQDLKKGTADYVCKVGECGNEGYVITVKLPRLEVKQ